MNKEQAFYYLAQRSYSEDYKEAVEMLIDFGCAEDDAYEFVKEYYKLSLEDFDD